jgi:hypothetical protein
MSDLDYVVYVHATYPGGIEVCGRVQAENRKEAVDKIVKKLPLESVESIDDCRVIKMDDMSPDTTWLA